MGSSKRSKLVLSALLRSRRDGCVQAEVAEFPEVKASAASIEGVLTRLRDAVRQRMRWTKLETSCSGDAISPVPKRPSKDGELTVAIDIESRDVRRT